MRKSLGGLKVATIRGVDIKLHISLLLMLLYVVVVATYQFRSVAEESGVDLYQVSGSPLFWGGLFAISLFFSILLHEFGHVIAAQSMNVKVSGITLMMLGGISEMEKIPERPYAEVRISIVGPLVSFALAGILFYAGTKTNSSNLALYCFWISRTNLVLAVFNLLPAFPLDGGRIFRSLLAARYGMARATLLAVRVAKGLAWVLGAIGFLTFNFLLMLIAFFVYAAASGEMVIAVSRALLKGIRAGQVGVTTPVIRTPMSIEEAIHIMTEEHERILPVVSPDGSLKLLSLTELKNIDRLEWQSRKAHDVAIPVNRAIDVNEALDEVLPEIATYQVLPLSDKGIIIGVIRYSDLMELIEFRSLGTDTAQAA